MEPKHNQICGFVVFKPRANWDGRMKMGIRPSMIDLASEQNKLLWYS